MSSGEEAVFDPDQPTGGASAQTELGYIEAALREINRTLIAIEAAILGADSTTVTTSINDEPFT